MVACLFSWTISRFSYWRIRPLPPPWEAGCDRPRGYVEDRKRTAEVLREALGDAIAEARVLFNWTGSKADVRRVMEPCAEARVDSRHVRRARSFAVSRNSSKARFPLTNGSGVFSQSLGEFCHPGRALFRQERGPQDASQKRSIAGMCSTMWRYANKPSESFAARRHIGRAVRMARQKATRDACSGTNAGIRLRAPGDEHVDRVYASADLQRDAAGMRLRGG